MTVLKAVLARLELAMDPYKPKMGKRRLKNDAEHKLMRQATKRRTASDKTLDSRKDKMYYKKNRNQLLQRHKRSKALHAHVLSSIRARLAQA